MIKNYTIVLEVVLHRKDKNGSTTNAGMTTPKVAKQRHEMKEIYVIVENICCLSQF